MARHYLMAKDALVREAFKAGLGPFEGERTNGAAAPSTAAPSASGEQGLVRIDVAPAVMAPAAEKKVYDFVLTAGWLSSAGTAAP